MIEIFSTKIQTNSESIKNISTNFYLSVLASILVNFLFSFLPKPSLDEMRILVII